MSDFDFKESSKEYDDVLKKIAESVSVDDLIYMLDMKIEPTRRVDSVITSLEGEKRHVTITSYKYE